MSAYGWIITVDHFNTENTRVGVMGPQGIPDRIERQLRLHREGEHFRLLDDDRNLIYEGLFLGDSEGEEALAPLDDFGMPDAGCTIIQYRNGNGNWEDL